MQQDPPPLSRHLRVRTEHGYTVLEFRGDIDIAAAVELTPLLDAVTQRPAPRIVIDLRQVDFFDCSGLRLLTRARSRVLDHGGRIHLVCTHPLTLRVLRITGVAEVLPPRAGMAEALGSPGAASGRS
ncbi:MULTISPECIES: anti-sigma factor antagonist [Streptomyces]|uniref:Anti-sigma factor antagonist n=1 Tax=Streptomyces griseoaurantiacus TaxID=68213 RepID=A0A1G7TK41_9ACTN|nr:MULTISPECIES: anti-sigma factor antagonist [Streptomyces]MCF0087905.1 Anti-sigma-B factor antagonist [Streptomyces sp. MH192]MCF0100155.1 Anti-sigma-B factor antagonist [Streptomyces sp. MH191]MDX3091453.1 anti-sigma factor antagonist [Streptomyces sp. ME12-02E]MDX3334916.1 anti-sigma factor antagonist [Streptomyces sp. ME02-6978a]MDX3361183.1 anti-sigma factor antagonist [Streptomyces sp. ME02-6978.2a]